MFRSLWNRLSQQVSRTRPASSRRSRRRLAVEVLEDRLAPAVSFTLAAGTLSVTYGLNSDSATLTATGSSSFTYSGTGTTSGSVSGVTAITVTEPNGHIGQSLILNGTGFNITGALSITNIESVTFATSDVLAAGSLSETGANTAVNLNNPGIDTSGTQSFANTVTLGNATVLLTNGLTMAAVNLGANALTVTGGGTISGTISGTGQLVASGSNSTLTLSKLNTWTAANSAAALTIDAGSTVAISADGNLGNSANGVTLNGGTLSVGTNSFTASARTFVMGTGGGTISNSTTLTLPAGSTITGATGFTKSGAGDLILNNPATAYTPGAITVSAGRLLFAGQNALGTGDVTVASGGSLVYNSTIAGALALANTVTLQSGSNISNRNSGNLMLNSSTVLPASGTVTFDSDDQPTGSAGIFVQAGDMLSNPGLMIQVGGNFGSIAGNASFGSVNLQGAIDDGGNTLTKTGPGTLTLSGLNSDSTGTVTVSCGTLVAFGIQNPGTGSLGSASIQLDGGNLKVDPIPSAWSAAGLTGRYYNLGFSPSSINQVDFSGEPVATRTDSTINFPDYTTSGLPSGIGTNAGITGSDNNFAVDWSGGLNILTGGSYTFTSSSDDGSQLYIDGTVVINNDGNHGLGGTASNGTVSLTAGVHTVEVRYFQGNEGAGAILSYQGPDSPTSTVIPGATSLSASGLFVPTTAAAFDNSVSIAAGTSPVIDLSNTAMDSTFNTLTVGAGATLNVVGSTSGRTANFGAVTLQGNATFNLTGANVALGAVSDNGGGFAITQTGTGNLTLTQPGSYSGGTILSSGTLNLGAAGALGSGPLSIASGGIVMLSAAGDLGDTINLTAGENLVVTQDNVLNGTTINVGPGATLQAQTANSLAGATINLNGGGLSLRADTATTFTAGAVTINDNSTINVDRLVTNASAQILTLSPTSLSINSTLTITGGAGDSLQLGDALTLTANLTINTVDANLVISSPLSGP